MTKSDDSLFTHHEHALEQAYGVCPECGGELSIRRGKTGAFIGCNAYPACQYTRPLVEQAKVEDRILPGSECPLCGHELAVKHGRYGMFIGCTNYPQCQHIEHQEQTVAGDVMCPSCNKGQLQEKNSRYGKSFYACDSYPKCKFAVNHPPVAEKCNSCGYPLLLKRQMAAGEKLQCANKKCGKFQ